MLTGAEKAYLFHIAAELERITWRGRSAEYRDLEAVLVLIDRLIHKPKLSPHLHKVTAELAARWLRQIASGARMGGEGLDPSRVDMTVDLTRAARAEATEIARAILFDQFKDSARRDLTLAACRLIHKLVDALERTEGSKTS